MMRIMTRRLAVAFACVASLGLAACAPGGGSSSEGTTTAGGAGEVSAADTTTDPADLTGDPGSDPGESGAVNTDPSTLGDVELTIWDQEVRTGQASQFTTLMDQFQAKYPNIKIVRQEHSFEDLSTLLALALADPTPPDVVQANNARSDMGTFVAAGQLLPLTAYADAYGWRDRFSPSVLADSSYSTDGKAFGTGEIWGLPQMGEIVGVFYNKAKLADLGLSAPATWDDFTAALAKAKQAGQVPLMLGNVEGWPAVHVFGQIQGALAPADQIATLGMGNPGASWQTDQNKAAAALLAEWASKGYFNEGFGGGDYDEVAAEFGKGTGVFFIAGSWEGADLDAAMGENVGFFVPSSSLPGGAKATTGATSLPFAISSKSKNPDAAAAFINFITSDDAMKVLADTGNLPILRTAELAPASGVWADVFKEFGDVTTNGSLLPYLDWATPTFGDDALKPGLQDLMAGKKSPDEFLAALQTDYAAFTQ